MATVDIDRLYNDPILLIDICQQVVDDLLSEIDVEKIREMEIQLQEINKIIITLESKGVSVPDTIRNEKSRIILSLDSHSDALNKISELTSAFEQMNNKLRICFTGKKENTSKAHLKFRPVEDETSKPVLREYIISTLRKMYGTANSTTVLMSIEKQLEGKLLPGDLKWHNSANMPVWRYNVIRERFRMTQEGILRNDSAHGVWAINEDNSLYSK